MKKIHLIVVTVILFLIGGLSSEKTQAQPTEDRVGFSVQAILPENQRDTGVTYFDLLVQPEDTQELQIEVFNHEDNELTVQVTPTTASTNSNGLIVYEPQEAYDESLNYPISELIEIPADTLTIPGGESRVINLTLDIPEEPFEGSLLGGIHFKKILDGEEEGSESVQIQNRYAYVIGLQVTEDDENVDPNLNLRGIESTLVNYRTSVIAKLQNDQPTIMNDVSISAEVYEEGGEEPIKTAEMQDAQFAPNSTMDFVIDWENNPLEAGNYRLELIATYPENTWEWQEEFTISAEDEELNEEAVEVENNINTSNLLIAGFIILIGVIIYLISYIKKLKDSQN